VNPPRKILIFRQSSLGDVVLTLPVVRRLKETFPEATIDFCTKQAFASIIQTQPAIGTTYVFHDNQTFLRLLNEIRRSHYDLFVDLQANFRSALIETASFPARTLRYKKRRLAREMVVRRAHLKLAVDHTVTVYLKPLRKLGLDISLSPPVMALPEEVKDFAGSFLRDSGLADSPSLVAFCPGASHFEKKWPQQQFAEVAGMFLNETGIGIVVITAEKDDVPESLGIDHDRLAGAKDLDILKVAALLSKCRVALTNDSGLMHLANAVGTPVLAIFGPTNPRLGFAPTLPGSRVICDDVICSPCSVHGQRPCYQPQKYCFKEITPARIFSELRKML